MLNSMIKYIKNAIKVLSTTECKVISRNCMKCAKAQIELRLARDIKNNNKKVIWVQQNQNKSQRGWIKW